MKMKDFKQLKTQSPWMPMLKIEVPEFRKSKVEENIVKGQEELMRFRKDFSIFLKLLISGEIKLDRNTLMIKQIRHEGESDEIKKKRKSTASNVPAPKCERNILLKKDIIRKPIRPINKNKEHAHSHSSSGNIVHFAHENYILVYNIMVGIKKAIDSTLEYKFYQIADSDFNLKCKFYILPWSLSTRGSSTKTKIKNCKFIDYAPQVFQNIRRIFGIKKEEFSRSLGPNHLFTTMQGDFHGWSELCSTGKSGSFFYYTEDTKYLLKTVSEAEFKFFKSILRNYYQHVKNNPDTLITRFFGLHKIVFFRKKFKSAKKIPFVIMNNVFETDKPIHERYDLKGSYVGRDTLKKDEDISDADPTVALKDNDIRRFERKISLHEPLKNKLFEQIKRDSAFFEENKIIDYSMLVGIHFKNRNQLESQSQVRNNVQFPGQQIIQQSSVNIPFFQSDYGGILGRNEDVVYFIGIIDILTQYNTKKKMEHYIKRIKHGEKMSCIPPTAYSHRFQKFMKLVFD